MAAPKPNFHLLAGAGELLVSIDSRSWHVLDEPDLFPEGVQLRKAFGVTWVSGLFREPPHGILQHIPAPDFRRACETVWQSLLRDRELLSCFAVTFQARDRADRSRVFAESEGRRFLSDELWIAEPAAGAT